MSVTFADGREAVSAQCPRGESSSFLPTPSLPRQALFSWPYGEPLNDARMMLAGFFNSLLGTELTIQGTGTHRRALPGKESRTLEPALPQFLSEILVGQHPRHRVT